MGQDKIKEIAFFNRYATSENDYNVFTDDTTHKIVQSCIEFSGLKAGQSIADLGCGAGVFTNVLKNMGFNVCGLDISKGLIDVASRKYPTIQFNVGDVELLPYESDSLDGIFLSGILHHLPDPSICAKEVLRVLKRGGTFVAFDPNRRNPFMWLYRDKNSPFYSQNGVTENERPIVASEIADVFTKTGFQVATRFLSGLHYRYIASTGLSRVLPIYNFLDDVLFQPKILSPYRAFVLTSGLKP